MKSRLLKIALCFLLVTGLTDALSPIAAERPRIEPAVLADRIHVAVNSVRESHGLPELDWDPGLAAIAQEHSLDMAKHDYLGHINSAGEDPSDRGRRAGYLCRKRVGGFIEEGLAENICRNSLFHATRYTVFGEGEAEVKERLWNTPGQIVDSTVKSWMESPEHRKNMLYPHYQSEGIGVVIDEEGRIYVTQLFC